MTLWAVKTREGGPHGFYALKSSLAAALDSMRKYRLADTRRTFYVVRDDRGIAEDPIQEATLSSEGEKQR
jgi:hypothetical protein